jgi:hypothetical protein
MDVKRKTCDIRTWKKHLFLDISLTNIDTLVPSLYQCVKTRSIEVFWVASATSAPPFQPLRHQRNVCYPVVNRFTRKTLLHRKQETLLYEYPLHWVLLPTKSHNTTLLFGSRFQKHGRHFDYWNRKQETLLYEYPLHWVLLPTKSHNTTLLFGSRFQKHGRHSDYWNQPVNMRMRVCYLDCHEAGLCCYLVIDIENILRPLQVF